MSSRCGTSGLQHQNLKQHHHHHHHHHYHQNVRFRPMPVGTPDVGPACMGRSHVSGAHVCICHLALRSRLVHGPCRFHIGFRNPEMHPGPPVNWTRLPRGRPGSLEPAETWNTERSPPIRRPPCWPAPARPELPTPHLQPHTGCPQIAKCLPVPEPALKILHASQSLHLPSELQVFHGCSSGVLRHVQGAGLVARSARGTGG